MLYLVFQNCDVKIHFEICSGGQPFPMKKHNNLNESSSVKGFFQNKRSVHAGHNFMSKNKSPFMLPNNSVLSSDTFSYENIASNVGRANKLFATLVNANP